MPGPRPLTDPRPIIRSGVAAWALIIGGGLAIGVAGGLALERRRSR